MKQIKIEQIITAQEAESIAKQHGGTLIMHTTHANGTTTLILSI